MCFPSFANCNAALKISGENSHKIPIEGLAGDESYSQIYNELCSFVMVGKKVVPPVFCKVSYFVAYCSYCYIFGDFDRQS